MTEQTKPAKSTKPPSPSHFLVHMRRRLQASSIGRLEFFDVAAFAAGDDGTAVQVKVRIKGEPSDDERAEVQRFAIAQYRYCFGEWATKQGIKVEARG